MRTVLGVLILIISIESQAQQLGFSMDARVSSPAVKLSKLQRDWEVSQAGSHAYGQGAIESWFELNAEWHFGYRKRVDYLIDFSPDTARFYTRLENGVVDPGSYDLQLKVNAFMAEGIFVARQFSLGPKGNLTLEFSGYQGLMVQLGSLAGSGQVDEDNDYRFVYDLDYHFDHSRWLDSPEERVTGWGYGVGFDLDYSLGRSWRLNIAVQDVFSDIFWSHVNRDRANCDTTSNGLGCLGKTEVVSKNQNIRSNSNWKIYGIKGRLRPYLTWGQWGRSQSWEIGFSFDKYSTGWDVENKVMNFTFDSDRLQVKWAFDNINANDAHHWQVSLGTVWPIL